MDIKCTVCGEPWYHELDMLEWEKKLFRAGAGCPACEGVAPAIPWEPETFEDIENGDDDPMDRLIALENRDARPAWLRPDPELLWKCAGCGVNVVRDPDDNQIVYDLPYGAKGRAWYSSHTYREFPGSTPAHTFGDHDVCAYCLKDCGDCGAPISPYIETGDVYDPGASFPDPADPYRAICIDCLEKRCSDCGVSYDECECEVDASPRG